MYYLYCNSLVINIKHKRTFQCNKKYLFSFIFYIGLKINTYFLCTDIGWIYMEYLKTFDDV